MSTELDTIRRQLGAVGINLDRAGDYEVEAIAVEAYRAGIRTERGWRDVYSDEDAIDVTLLRALAVGVGGRRTGAMQRKGLLEWRVTRDGWELLEQVGLAERNECAGCMGTGRYQPLYPTGPQLCASCGGAGFTFGVVEG